MSARTVVVAVPAHDEAETVGQCLEYAVRAAQHAVAAGTAGTVLVALAAHRCCDDTESVALRYAAALPASAVRLLVTRDEVSRTVGEVRARLLRTVDEEHRLAEDSWVFNTDADSRVPADWITRTLAHAADRDAHLVTGLVELGEWTTSAVALEAYASLLRLGTRVDGHDHVYGANLAVRWDAYVASGGFPAELPEDHGLVERVRSGPHRWVSSSEPTVWTSARRVGRAPQGLAVLLAGLQELA